MLVKFKTHDGLKQWREVPDEANEDEYKYGIVLGPPSFDSITMLTKAEKLKLSNTLFDEHFITYDDIRSDKARLRAMIAKLTKSNQKYKGLFRLVLSVYQQAFYPELF